MDALVEAVAVADAPLDYAPSSPARGSIVNVLSSPAVSLSPDHSRLTEEQRWGVIVLHKQGKSFADIAKELNVGHNTPGRVWRRYTERGTPLSSSRSGRPRSTTEDENYAMELHARIDKFTTPNRIKKQLFLDVSPRTIDRRLQDVGLFGRVAVKKRNYNTDEVRKRLAFANGYKDWTAVQWENVLFSDERTFWGHGACGHTYVRRPKGEAFNPEYCIHKKAHPVKMGAWACFSAKGAGYLKMYEETMDAKLHRRILDSELIPSARRFWSLDLPNVQQWYLLHDNDKKFDSGLVNEWLHNHGITKLDFPPYSPDLNPIENLWFMAKGVDKHCCETTADLEEAILTEWKALNEQSDLLKSLVHSMPARCQAVIDAKGWHTKY